jgi:menaquinone-9 beta-reductase
VEAPVKIAATVVLEAAATSVWDAIIVGAGPAGSLTARQLARLGRKVLLVDKAAFPRAKVCGCCISGSAQLALREAGLGDLTERLGAIPLQSILLSAGRRTAALPLPDGVALSRECFDAALVREAIAAGADFLPEASVRATRLSTACAQKALRSEDFPTCRDDGHMQKALRSEDFPTCRDDGHMQEALRSEDSASRLTERESPTRKVEIQQRHLLQTIEARVVVAADGLAGGSFGEQGQAVALRNSRIGVGAIASSAPGFYEPGTVYMACSSMGYAGLVRLEDGRVDIAAALDPGQVRSRGGPAAVVANILAETSWPELELESLHWRGTPMLTRSRSRLGAERLLITGDAAGYIEPFTGEGIAWALNSAMALAPIVDKSIADWRPDYVNEWTRIHHRLIGPRQRSCRLIARALRSGLLTRFLVRVLSIVPAVATRFIRRLNGAPGLD